MQTIIHADDYGITKEQSYSILSCSDACGGRGPLNSTSILVGSPHAQECAALVAPFVQQGNIRIALHINLVEGPCCANSSEVPSLVDDRGMFSLSFVSLVKKSLDKNNTAFKQQIQREVSAQIEKYLQLFPWEKNSFRIDSHQHTLLIPVIMNAVLNEVAKRAITPEYIRIPAEPLSPFLKNHQARMCCSPINTAKALILNSLWLKCTPMIRSRYGMSRASFIKNYSATFFGVMFSGHMFDAANPAIMNMFKRAAKQRANTIEVLFHPGGINAKDACLNQQSPEFTNFYISNNREKERRALQNMDFLPYCALKR